MPNYISKKQIFIIAVMIFAVTMGSVFLFVEKDNSPASHKGDYQAFVLNDFDAEKNLSEDEYRKILDASEDEFIIVNTDRTFKFITPGLEEIHGYTLDEMESENINVLTFIHPKDLPAFSNILLEFHKKLEIMNNVGPIRVKTKEGDYINYLIKLIPFTDSKGERIGTGVIFKNIDKPLGDKE